MFISKLNSWLDRVDPYAVQWMALQKALVIATIMVLGYWFFRPMNYIAYILPTLVLAVYDRPGLSCFKQKNTILLFAFIAMLFCGTTFYAFFPFRVFFLFYSLVFFSILYILTLRLLPYAKYSPLMTLSSSLFFITITPTGDRQITYDILCSSLLSMFLLLTCLQCLRYRYFINWRLAEQKFIKTLEKDIAFTLSPTTIPLFLEEIHHLNIVYSYRGLLKKSQRLHAYKLSYNTRNIQFALSNVHYHEKNDQFWHTIRYELSQLRQHMAKATPYLGSSPYLITVTRIEEYTICYLRKAIRHWNELCKIY